MCELFGLCARHPTSVRLSLGGLAAHSGPADVHRDGWGVAFVRDRDAMLIKEPEAAADSPLARFIENAGIESTIVVSHIRKATRGSKTYANTHPFVRELGGRAHVFAHNGSLPDADALPTGRFSPIGATDSERAFCHLLHRLEPLWRSAAPPTVEQRFAVVAEVAREFGEQGPANFLYSDTDALFIHAHRRPKQDDAEPDRPGLHVLERMCDIDLSSVQGEHRAADGPQLVHLVATTPLSEESWRPMGIGELAVAVGGVVVTACNAS